MIGRSSHLGALLRLAIPVVFAELGWMAMTTVDTIMIGPLGPASIGAIGVGSSVFYALAIFGMGILLSMDKFVSQAFGRRDYEDCDQSLVQGIYLALGLSLPLSLIFYLLAQDFGVLNVVEPVSTLAGAFLQILSLSTVPLLLYAALRRYLQAIGHVRPVMFALVSANLINWFFNWLLIKGHWHFPPLGVRGSALSTVFARLYMTAVLATYIFQLRRSRPWKDKLLSWGPNPARLRQLFWFGVPAATQILLEISAFGTAAILAGTLSPVASAAHQIAINCAAMTFMVPLGISSAAAVSVGHAEGSGDSDLARKNGNLSILLACGFMACAALAFLLFPRAILHVYTQDVDVVAVGVRLLAIAAAFQLFDGIQTVVTGALRGLGHTRGPMLVNLAGYWLLGIPVGYWLCFKAHFGIDGLWIGLTVALVAIAVSLLRQWMRLSKRDTGHRSIETTLITQGNREA